ncbi:MAG: DinB family protein [Chitinophagaceae bacterium]|nr:DinB family protein [Chitinophagaceae bacterium]
MTKQEIKNKLTENHHRLIDLVLSLSDTDFLHSANGKWTAGQQLDHICRSVYPVRLAFSLPRFMLSLFFGKSNRPSRDYDELVAKYLKKLEGNYQVAERFVPKPVQPDKIIKLKDELLKAIDSLNKNIDKYSEERLDKQILPHPLLGKLTLREMLYFTIYHAEHHRKLVLQYLGR